MDRISSCATSNSSETRTSLSVLSRVANLLAIDFPFPGFVRVWNLKRGTTGIGGTITFILSFIKITTLPHSSRNYNKISAADKQGSTGLSSSQFILSGFDVVWR